MASQHVTFPSAAQEACVHRTPSSSAAQAATATDRRDDKLASSATSGFESARDRKLSRSRSRDAQETSDGQLENKEDIKGGRQLAFETVDGGITRDGQELDRRTDREEISRRAGEEEEDEQLRNGSRQADSSSDNGEAGGGEVDVYNDDDNDAANEAPQELKVKKAHEMWKFRMRPADDDEPQCVPSAPFFPPPSCAQLT